MGTKRSEEIVVRELENVVIVFFDNESIYVFPRGSSRGTIFHRWFAVRKTYRGSWEPFRRELMRQKTLSFMRCHQLASKYRVLSASTVRWPLLGVDAKKIKYIDN